MGAAPAQVVPPPDSSGDGAAAEVGIPRLAASLAEPEPGRKRTHEELVQLMGADAPRAPNRKKRRLELQVHSSSNLSFNPGHNPDNSSSSHPADCRSGNSFGATPDPTKCHRRIPHG